jgi:1-acyl-sn-glycerol-3-phosphate acyltransferase
MKKSNLLSLFSNFLAGHIIIEPNILENKQVLIGFEHTSNMDAVLSLALFEILDIKIHTLIKKELLKGR